jgi:hypothetical protein
MVNSQLSQEFIFKLSKQYHSFQIIGRFCMKKSLCFVSMLMMFMVYAEDTVVMKNGAKAWSDRDYVISGLPSEWEFSKPVRVQRCTGYSLSSPQGAKQILIGLYSSPASRTIAEDKGLINTGKTFNISSLKYDVYVWKNPPEIFSFKETSAGVVLLAVDDDVPAIDAGNGVVSPAVKSEKTPNADAMKSKITALASALNKLNTEKVDEVNVKSVGAVGDGIADDTDALQLALDLASHPSRNGRIYIPAGTYRVTKTLLIDKKQSLIVRGDGSSKFSAQPLPFGKSTLLAWDGPDGGTLINGNGIGACVFQYLNFSGQVPRTKEPKRMAGILFLSTSPRGHGNMLNTFDHVGFYNTVNAVQMGQKNNEICNADVFFNFTVFCQLKNGLTVLGSQGVDYYFNFMFVCEVECALNFERGGNLLVNNAQLTKCDLFLYVGLGAKMGGVYLANNVRLESSGGGRMFRHQLLKTNPTGTNCVIKFTGFNDCQWDWGNNQTDRRGLPLCEINGGALVTFENSIFLTPVATVKGFSFSRADRVITFNGGLVMRECVFYLPPTECLASNSLGYFQVLNCVNGNGTPLPDVRKWPKLDTTIIPVESDYLETEKSWKATSAGK